MGTSKTLDFYEITVARQIELYTQTEYWAVAVYKGYFRDNDYELIWEDETRDGYDTDTVLNGKSLQDLLDNAHQIIKGEQK
jgi:hypothetical protein